MKQSVWTTQSNPQMFITKDKQRIKQFEGQVYLNDGDEYQIELFNPTPNHILAKIKIDTDYISGGGIALRPGERVFLERFLDSNNKFVFRTYEVDNEGVESGATSNNGYIEVEFYNETKSQSLGSNTITTNGLLYGNNTLPYHSFTTNNTGNVTFTTSGTSIGYASSNINTTYTTNTLSNTFLSHLDGTVTNTVEGPNKRNSLSETGITERGDKSSQKFESSTRTFSFSSFYNISWRILPNSQKTFNKEELNVLYCGECGSKRKKDTHKFCPHCGTKF